MTLGMKAPKTHLPALQLVAVVVSGKKIYRKNLPLSAMNAANFQIFTPENIAAIKRFPDSLEDQGNYPLRFKS